MDNQDVDAACDEVFDLSDLLVNIAFTGNIIHTSTLGFNLLFNSLAIACPGRIAWILYGHPDFEAALQVPEPQRLISRGRHGPAPISRHRHGVDPARMAFERPNRLATFVDFTL